MSFKFEILKKSKKSRARVGRITTDRGIINTPIFMPVGTQATVKTMTPDALKEIGAEIILSNTYHLLLRPGPELIKEAGGLHKFMNWDKPILTDSGGFQIYSLAHMRKITDKGVEFTSHIDGKKHFLTPESVLDIQAAYGSDISMVLDECVELPSDRKTVEKAVRRTTEWARKSKIQNQKSKQGTLFGIVQGGCYPELRKRSAEEIAELDFAGNAIGGLSVGESQREMFDMIEVVNEILPEDKPRYLMGVGFPEDIKGAVERGCDMFDCVIPTRLARHGTFLTDEGRLSIRQTRFERDFTPLDTTCDCYACRNFTKAYIRHIFWAREILAMQLLTHHNLRYYMRTMEKIRNEISG